MKERCKRLVLALTAVGWLCVLAACTPVTVDESAGNAEPVDTPPAASASSGEQADAQPTDIIDRIFSPLDNAVTDINRDLNKGDTDSPPGPGE